MSARLESVRHAQIDVRQELEHRLSVFANRHRLTGIRLQAEKQCRDFENAAYEISVNRNGSKLIIAPWKKIPQERVNLSQAQAIQTMSLNRSDDRYQVGLTVTEMPTSVLDSASGSPELDNFAKECNALTAALLTDDVESWLEIARHSNCAFLTPLVAVILTGASSAILWFTAKSDAGRFQLRPMQICGSVTSKRGRRPPLTMNFGEGVVGLAASTQRNAHFSGRALMRVAGSPDLVQREGWTECYAVPLVFDNETKGVISLYSRSAPIDLGGHDQVWEHVLPIATLHAARRSRTALIDYEQRTLMRGVMRLQAGLTMVGLVHDLARHAKLVHSWAESLKEPLRTVSLKAGVVQTVEEMIRSADLVGDLTASMDALVLGRQDREGDIIIPEVLTSMIPLLQKFEPRVRVSIQGTATIHGPSSAIERIVWNLVMNSVNWTSKETRDIQVKFERVETANTASLTVIDNGVGISPPERIPSLTEPFVSFRENGSGLGLYLVSELCKRVGARPPVIHSTPHRATSVKIKFLRLMDEVG